VFIKTCVRLKNLKDIQFDSGLANLLEEEERDICLEKWGSGSYFISKAGDGRNPHTAVT